MRDACRYSMCPLAEERTSRPWSIHATNVVQPDRKAVLTRAAAWMNPEGIVLSDISQTRRTSDVRVHSHKAPRAVGSISSESRMLGVRAEGGERGLGVSRGLSQFCKTEVMTEQQECPQACTAAALTAAETWN